MILCHLLTVLGFKHLFKKTLFYQKFNRRKYNLRKIKEVNAKLKELQPDLEAAQAAVAQIQDCVALAPNDPSRDEVRLSKQLLSSPGPKPLFPKPP